MLQMVGICWRIEVNILRQQWQKLGNSPITHPRNITGHVLRREEEYVEKRAMVMEVPGKRRRARLNRGGWITSRTTCWRENCQGGSA